MLSKSNEIKPFVYENNGIVLYSFSKKLGLTDTKDVNMFTILDTLFKKIIACKEDKKKLDKLLEKEETVSMCTSISDSLKAIGSSGNLVFVKPTGTKLKYEKWYPNSTVKLSQNAIPIAKSKYPGKKNLYFAFDSSFQASAQLVSDLKAINSKVSSMIQDYNKVLELIKEKPLEYKELIGIDNSIGVNIAFEGKKKDNIMEYTGYPWFKSAKDCSAVWNLDTGGYQLTKMIEFNGKMRPVPVEAEDIISMDRDLFHEDVIHEQFGKGTLLRGSFNIQWSYSQGKVQLKLSLASNEICIAPKAPDNSEVGDLLEELRNAQKEQGINISFKNLNIASEGSKNIIDIDEDDGSE